MAKPLTKSEILVRIAKATGLSRKQAASVLNAISGLIAAALYKKGGAGTTSLRQLVIAMHGRFCWTSMRRPVRSSVQPP